MSYGNCTQCGRYGHLRGAASLYINLQYCSDRPKCKKKARAQAAQYVLKRFGVQYKVGEQGPEYPW